MKKLAALLLALVMLVPAFALADGTEITASGMATVAGTPDMVIVAAQATVVDKRVDDVQGKMGEIIENVTGKLVELGVLEEDIVTRDYTYYPHYDYSGEVSVQDGFQANHTLEITCRDVEMLDSVLGVLSDNGMTEIYDVHFDASNRQELYGQALELAIAEAGKKAAIMAKASGLEIRELDSLTEIPGYDRGARPEGIMGSSMNDSLSSGIRSGIISVTASVTAVYDAE